MTDDDAPMDERVETVSYSTCPYVYVVVVVMDN